MQQLITESEARKITGGRKPLVPIEYERACKDLVLCQTIDEAKYFSDKADALAVWAKIYRDDDAGREARALKLHAYRRMGLLAMELRPGGIFKRGPKGGRKQPGPPSVLKENGLDSEQTRAAVLLAKIPSAKFKALTASPKPPSLNWVRREYEKKYSSEGWQILTNQNESGVLQKFVQWCGRHSAKEVSATLNADEVRKSRLLLTAATEWLDELEQHLPKEKQ